MLDLGSYRPKIAHSATISGPQAPPTRPRPRSGRTRVGSMAATSEATGLDASKRHRVLIIGGGFGGLFASRLLKRAPVDVTLVDRVNHHLFQPLLYQVATGILSEGQIAPPIRNVLRRQQNTRVELASVIGFDLDR